MKIRESGIKIIIKWVNIEHFDKNVFIFSIIQRNKVLISIKIELTLVKNVCFDFDVSKVLFDLYFVNVSCWLTLILWDYLEKIFLINFILVLI